MMNPTGGGFYAENTGLNYGEAHMKRPYTLYWSKCWRFVSCPQLSRKRQIERQQ